MLKTLRVAAIQTTSLNGQMARNLDHATHLVNEAVANGAELVVCPELLAAGYVYSERLWDSAEQRGGPTERWLSDLARRHQILIGAGFIEADGEHFFNSFSLFGRDGALLGRVRKRSRPFGEAWYFSASGDAKVIHTELGKIGVGICHDSHTAQFFEHMIDERPDLILMPHSAASLGRPFLDRVLGNDHELRSVAAYFARALGVPVVMANKVSNRTALFAAMPSRKWWQFHGYSTICDGDGTVLAERADAEAALVADVHLNPAQKSATTPRPQGYWSFGRARLSVASAMWAIEAIGARAYALNPRRAGFARRINRVNRIF